MNTACNFINYLNEMVMPPFVVLPDFPPTRHNNLLYNLMEEGKTYLPDSLSRMDRALIRPFSFSRKEAVGALHFNAVKWEIQHYLNDNPEPMSIERSTYLGELLVRCCVTTQSNEDTSRMRQVARCWYKYSSPVDQDLALKFALVTHSEGCKSHCKSMIDLDYNFWNWLDDYVQQYEEGFHYLKAIIMPLYWLCRLCHYPTEAEDLKNHLSTSWLPPLGWYVFRDGLSALQEVSGISVGFKVHGVPRFKIESRNLIQAQIESVL
ncbi:MAG: hypothetical protein SFY67_05115 [Candidatus Melainabacteria bacterium]|nr:hypothetical protein [Candidatus Melainabacteria bacterium]